MIISILIITAFAVMALSLSLYSIWKMTQTGKIKAKGAKKRRSLIYTRIGINSLFRGKKKKSKRYINDLSNIIGDYKIYSIDEWESLGINSDDEDIQQAFWIKGKKWSYDSVFKRGKRDADGVILFKTEKND